MFSTFFWTNSLGLSMFSWFKIGPFDFIECVKAGSAPSCTFCLGDSSHYARNPKTCVMSLQHMTLLDLCVSLAQGAMLNMFDKSNQKDCRSTRRRTSAGNDRKTHVQLWAQAGENKAEGGGSSSCSPSGNR